MKKDLNDLMDRVLGERPSTLDRVLQQKTASAEPSLLSAAARLRPEDPLALYEELGGVYQEGSKE